jgi:hypothetical protein
MSNLQVRIHIRKEKGENNQILIHFKTIKLPNENTTFIFPDVYQDESHHKQLLEISTIKNACKSMTKENQYRNLTVTLPADVARLYLDSEGNFVFKDFFWKSKFRVKLLMNLFLRKC